MSNCLSDCQNSSGVNHINAFVNLNGIPYLLAEYLDRHAFQQIDRSAIKSEILIDQSECMRAIVDISIDDIGKRASDGLPNTIGNNTKQQSLIDMIRSSYQELEHKLPVLRRGIVIRVNYQLENQRTGQVIRTAIEDLRITDRNYFIEINKNDINDNAIIVNFSNSMVSTVNQFTHGADPMLLRITSIQMSYECVKPNPMTPRVTQSMVTDPEVLKQYYGYTDGELYKYHQQMQSRHFLGTQFGQYGNEDPRAITPPTWSSFNRFYHFDETTKDIVLHDEEINDSRAQVIQLACGSVQVNRAFVINPGARIIFKFSIWKNDVTVVNDCSAIAAALQAYVAPSTNTSDESTGCPYCSNQMIDLNTLKMLMSLCNQMHGNNHQAPQNIHHKPGPSPVDYQQNAAINKLNETLANLAAMVKDLHPDESTDTDGESSFTPLPEHPGGHKPHHKKRDHEQIKIILEMLSVLQTQLIEIKNEQDNDENYVPIPTDMISQIIADINREFDIDKDNDRTDGVGEDESSGD